MSLLTDIQNAINCHCSENVSNTPDFILAEYLAVCLSAFDAATIRRDKWYSVHLEPANSHFIHEEALECTKDEKQTVTQQLKAEIANKLKWYKEQHESGGLEVDIPSVIDDLKQLLQLL